MYQFVKILAGDEIKAAEEAANIETAKRMLKDGDLTRSKIAMYTGLSIKQVEQLAIELESEMQMA